MDLWRLKDPFAPPNGEIRRYLEPWKFHRLLEDRALHFTSVERLQFDDPKEATFSPGVAVAWDALWREKAEVYAARARRAAWGSHTQSYIESLENIHSQSVQDSAAETFVNSWRAGSDETCEMWQRYGADPAAVAIVSSVDSLVEALEAEDWLHGGTTGWVGQVRYDWAESPSDVVAQLGPVTIAFLKERNGFVHEQEVRIAVHSREARDVGFTSFRVPLNALIRGCVLSPWAGQVERDEVSRALERAELDVPLRASNLTNSH